MKHLIPYISEKVHEKDYRHEITHFDSGAVMIDIWVNDRLWVIQIEGNTIGLSEVTENTGIFDIIPDVTFTADDEFKNAFLEIL